MRPKLSSARLLSGILTAAVLATAFRPGSCLGAWATWTQWNTNGFGNTNNYSVFELEVYDNDLYAGTHNITQGCEIYRYDGPNPVNWTRLTSGGFSAGCPPLRLAADARALPRFCREHGIDVVHCHLLHDHWLAVLVLRALRRDSGGRPLIVRTLHGSAPPRGIDRLFVASWFGATKRHAGGWAR